MADVTSTFGSLSSTESSNNPSGSTNVGSGLDDNLRSLQALIAAWRDQTAWGTLTLTSVAGTNTITATLATSGSVTFGPTALAAGMKFLLTPAVTNTGATTLNITSPNGGSALGAKNVFAGGAACVGGELVAGVPAVVEYDGTQFNILGFFHFNALTSEASPATGDFVPLYDISETGYNKATIANIFALMAAAQSDQETATSTTLYVTPGRQQFHPSAAKFWAKANSGGTLVVSYNMTSITDVGVGQISGTIATDFSSADWVGQVSVERSDGQLRIPEFVNEAAGTFSANCYDASSTNVDPTQWFFTGFGDQ